MRSVFVGEGRVQEQLYAHVRDCARRAARHAPFAQEVRSLAGKFQETPRTVKCIVGSMMKRKASVECAERRRGKPRTQHGRKVRQHRAQYELRSSRPASCLVTMRDQCVTKKIHGKRTD